MIDNVQNIELGHLVKKAQALFSAGYRFVTVDCVQLESGWQLLYHFDKDLELVHYRVEIEPQQTIPSISKVYFAALLIENEMQDLFGLSFEGLVVDFKGKLFLGDNVGPAPQVISNLVVQITQKGES